MQHSQYVFGLRRCKRNPVAWVTFDTAFKFQFEESVLHFRAVCMALTDQFVNQQWLGSKTFAHFVDQGFGRLIGREVVRRRRQGGRRARATRRLSVDGVASARHVGAGCGLARTRFTTTDAPAKGLTNVIRGLDQGGPFAQQLIGAAMPGIERAAGYGHDIPVLLDRHASGDQGAGFRRGFDHHHARAKARRSDDCDVENGAPAVRRRADAPRRRRRFRQSSP